MVCLVLQQNDNAWSFPKGGRKKHETVQMAALRELYEETGLTSQDITPICDAEFVLRKAKKTRAFMRTGFFVTSLCGDATFNIQDKREIKACLFVPVAMAKKLLDAKTAVVLKAAIQMYCHHNYRLMCEAN